MELSVIIVNYNTEKLTIQAINSINKYCSNISFEIIVVDNSINNDKHKNKISLIPKVKYFQLKENIGFGKANNYGYQKSSGKFLFLFNSDAYLISKNTISIMINYLNTNKDVACVGGNLITPRGNPNISYGNFLKVERILYDYGLVNVSDDYFKNYLATSRFCDFKEPTEVDHVTGAAILIKKCIVDKFGLFDPKYFMYLEDMDLAYKLKSNGFKSVILPNVKIVHIGGQSRVNDIIIRKKIHNEIQKSRLVFLKKTTNSIVAYNLYFLGKIIIFYRRVLKKIRRILKNV